MNYEELAKDWLATSTVTLIEKQREQFIMFCKLNRLNPFKGEAYGIPFGGQLQLVTSYLVICARAKQNPKYYREVIEYWRNGEKLNHPHLDPVSCEGVVICVNIYDKEGNLISNYDFDIAEYARTNKGSFKLNYFNSWAEKCAITNALRRTFPNEVTGLYIQEEMPDVSSETGEVTKPAKTRKHPAISAQFKNVVTEIKNKVTDPKKQVALIEGFAKKIGKTHDDLTAGNFDVGDFMEYVEEQVGEKE